MCTSNFKRIKHIVRVLTAVKTPSWFWVDINKSFVGLPKGLAIITLCWSHLFFHFSCLILVQPYNGLCGLLTWDVFNMQRLSLQLSCVTGGCCVFWGVVCLSGFCWFVFLVYCFSSIPWSVISVAKKYSCSQLAHFSSSLFFLFFRQKLVHLYQNHLGSIFPGLLNTFIFCWIFPHWPCL